jgi:hypothetical protein
VNSLATYWSKQVPQLAAYLCIALPILPSNSTANQAIPVQSLILVTNSADIMSSLFGLGQVLRGKLGKYVISREIQSGVWLAK